MLYSLSISPSLTWSFYLYLAKSTSYDAPHYAAFSNLLSLHLSSVRIISSTPSVYVPPLTSKYMDDSYDGQTTISKSKNHHVRILAYRLVARQRPGNKKRNIRPIYEQRLGKHVPAETRRTQQYSYNGKGGVFYVVRAEKLKRRQLRQSSSVPVVSWKSACEEKTRRLVWNGRQPGTQLVEGWQLSRPLQGRLRRDGAIVELTVDRSSVRDGSIEAEEQLLLLSVTKQRLVKTVTDWEDIVCHTVICEV
jgi:hypothetical protein